jgi:hypothetical protein
VKEVEGEEGMGYFLFPEKRVTMCVVYMRGKSN